MGLLDQGVPVDWKEAKSKASYVRKHGIIQFLNNFHLNKYRQDDELKWGDELEYQLVYFDEEKKEVYLALGAEEILENLAKEEQTLKEPRAEWHPEYADSMIEALPYPPYDNDLNKVQTIENSMYNRRQRINTYLKNKGIKNTHIIGISMFGLMGVKNEKWLQESSLPDPEHSFSRSLFVPDSIVNKHPRFKTLTSNIRQRRNAKVIILTPVYPDKYTSNNYNDSINAYIDNIQVQNKNGLNDYYNRYILNTNKIMNPINNFIYMDCMAFGMGSSCEQITFLTSHLCDAVRLHDNFVTLAPYILSLTATSSIQRGMLSNFDTRWKVISQCVDCRTNHEQYCTKMNRCNCKEDEYKGFNSHIPKSRYDGISLYLSHAISSREGMNNIRMPLYKKAIQLSLLNNVGPNIASQLGFLLIRDPMVIFSDYDTYNDYKSNSHFENFQSTNWNSVRLKLSNNLLHKHQKNIMYNDSNIGWRVEFRVPEIQITDFENAAVAAILLLLVDYLKKNPKTEFCIPMTYNDDNLMNSCKIDAVLKEKFVFRKDWTESVFYSEENTSLEHSKALDSVQLDNNKENETSPIHKMYKTVFNGISSIDDDLDHFELSDLSNEEYYDVNMIADKTYYTTNKNINKIRFVDDPNNNRCCYITTEKVISSNNNINNQLIHDCTINEIMNGSNRVQGILPSLINFLDDEFNNNRINEIAYKKYVSYIKFFEGRANGTIQTNAKYFREYVLNHNMYKHDSVVHQNIIFDLYKNIIQISNGNGNSSSIIGMEKPHPFC